MLTCFRESLKTALNLFKGNIVLKADFRGNTNASKSSKTIEGEVSKDIESKTKVFNVFVVIVNKLLSLSLFLLFIQSFWYLRNYLAKDAYDNVYITKEFKQLDEKALAPILPLKQQERKEYVETSSWKMNDFELKYCRLGVAQVFLHFLICIVLVLFDYSLYYILNLVRKYGSVDVKVQGHGTFKVTVNGAGPIAEFYRILLKGLDIDNGFTASLHVNRCLPDPSEPPSQTIPILLFLYAIALGFCILRAYGMRLRRKIASYYYPEQERARMEYLHKTIRHRRAGFLRFLRQDVKSSHKERVTKNEFRLSTWVASRCPCIEKWLPDTSDLECTGCEQRTGGLNKVRLINCPSVTNGVQCPAVYCDECNRALEGICPLCSDSNVSYRR